MSTGYVSADGHWRVRAIILDGEGRLRLEHDSPHFTGKPTDDTDHRNGMARTGVGWWLVGDMATVAEVAEYVPLEQLTLIKGS